MATTETPRSFSFVKFYFTIVSVVSVIGMVIAYAIASYQLLKLALITDEEWITQRGWYEIEACSQPTSPAVDAYGMAKPVVEPGVVTPRTPQEVTECETKARERLVAQRAYETKDTTSGGLVRGTFLLVLFLTHYPRMMRLEKKRSTEAPSETSKTSKAPKARIASKTASKKKA